MKTCEEDIQKRALKQAKNLPDFGKTKSQAEAGEPPWIVVAKQGDDHVDSNPSPSTPSPPPSLPEPSRTPRTLPMAASLLSRATAAAAALRGAARPSHLLARSLPKEPLLSLLIVATLLAVVNPAALPRTPSSPV